MENVKKKSKEFGYVCQLCGEHREVIVHRCSKAYPFAICPECEKIIDKLIYQEDK